MNNVTKMELYKVLSKPQVYIIFVVGLIIQIIMAGQMRTTMFNGYHKSVYENYMNEMEGEYSIEKKYSSSTTNEYYIDDNFNYVDNYTGMGINNHKELINFIYYTLNSGIHHTERYITKNYTNYLNDINMLTINKGEGFKETISLLNNFVHPYNSSNNIKLNYGGEYKIGITINKAYSNEEITKINEVVDKVIKEKITNNMPTREKIKVIHDYIIDNAEYDKLKYENKNDTTYKSNTAYGVLIEGYGTCNGYADAMAIFLDNFNVINFKISIDEHIWNLV